MTNQPIPVPVAESMIKEYINLIGSGVTTEQLSKQTQNVAFQKKEVLPWLNEVMQYADQIRVCFGVYPPGHEQGGKLTVILWPYKDGKPATWPLEAGKAGDGDPGGLIKPFNEGQGTP